MISICFDDIGNDFNATAQFFPWAERVNDDIKKPNFIVEQSEPAWKQPVVAKLNELARLRADWDSYGAQPVQPTYINAVLTLLTEVMLEETPVPWIVPTPDGRLQVEWHLHDLDLEIEPVDSSSFSVGFEDVIREADEEFFVLSDLTRLADILRELTLRATQA